MEDMETDPPPLMRIAAALERQVEQHDEAVQRSLRARAENLELHMKDAEQSRRDNAELIKRLDTAMGALERMSAAVSALHIRVEALERSQECEEPRG